MKSAVSKLLQIIVAYTLIIRAYVLLSSCVKVYQVSVVGRVLSREGFGLDVHFPKSRSEAGPVQSSLF